MNKKPFVSILMPSYNSEEFIGIAIKSVLDSTYTNFELIITDDNSTDSTYKIAKSFQEKDARVKVFLNDKNYGDYPNRNKAASYAKGKYLKYVDHDDYIYPYGLEQLVYYMEQFPEAGYGLCTMEPQHNQPYPLILSPESAYLMNYSKMGLFVRAPLSSIIKRNVFLDVGGFSGKPFLGDLELWHKLSQKHNLLLMPGGIVWYRKHEHQESKKMFGNPDNEFEYLLIGEDFIKSSLCPLKGKDKERVLELYKKRKVRFFLSTIKNHSIKKGVEIKKKGEISLKDVFFYPIKK